MSNSEGFYFIIRLRWVSGTGPCVTCAIHHRNILGLRRVSGTGPCVTCAIYSTGSCPGYLRRNRKFFNSQAPKHTPPSRGS
jgi:hypothetical protein